MKVSLQWIKDYVPVNVSRDQLVHQLTMAGLEVEKVLQDKGDTILELEITPNRPDCLNMVGLAREIAAILDNTHIHPKIKKRKWPEQRCSVTLKDPQGCRRYIGVVIQGLRIKEAPQSIRNRLVSLQIRNINNVVDITNFCLHELGQPLHAFDYDKLHGGKIIVRRAKEGEKILTLDGVERLLDPSILVIADADRPVAIAGIMGGKETEVGPQTKNILLESAQFDPVLIRRAARKLKLSSDSSYRFERGTDFYGVDQGALRAVDLILQHASGKITHYTDCVTKPPETRPEIKVSIENINTILGGNLPIQDCAKILKKLAFKVARQKGHIKVTPPSFRQDIHQAEDIIEEIARIVGYDRLPSSLPPIKILNIQPDPKRRIRTKIKRCLCAQGIFEVITYAMYHSRWLKQSRQKDLKGVFLKNPLTQDHQMMRPSLLPSFLSLAKTNINRGSQDLRFFETGKIYTPKEEKEILGLLLTGVLQRDWRLTQKRWTDFYDIKGVIESLFGHLEITGVSFQQKDCLFLDPAEAADIYQDGQLLGWLGRVHQDVLYDWGIKQKNVFFAQIDLETLYNKAPSSPKQYAPIIEFPAITRDISLAVKEEVCFEKIKALAFRLGHPILASITFTEQYLGDKLKKGYRGLVFSLKYQSAERTLREQEVNATHEKIEQALIHELGTIRR